MAYFATVLVILVACLHFYFLALEMFLWEKPLGMRVFRMTPEKAKTTAVLAANQGLYNGFLAAGLLISFAFEDSGTRFAFQAYFLVCVIVAGIYGAMTVSKKILWVQAGPAVVALAVVFLTRSI